MQIVSIGRSPKINYFIGDYTIFKMISFSNKLHVFSAFQNQLTTADLKSSCFRHFTMMDNIATVIRGRAGAARH